jgi:glutamate-1-semialdehyde 2,1-aminomutase
MAAGVAGYGEVYTPEAADALNARGETIRNSLNGICRKADVAFQFSGIGSMMSAHATRRPIRTAADIASSNQDAKELFYFDMMAAGIWIARRGFVALNIMIGDAEAERFVAAVEEFVTARKALLK